LVVLFFGLTKNSEAQDWPDLKKYEEANAAVLQLPLHQKRVVFMGNSITEEWKALDTTFFDANERINRGIGGQTTPQMVLRFRQDVISLNPKVVVILAGTNDIAGNTGPMSLAQIHDNILSMVELAKANGIVPIVCSVLPAYDYPWKPGRQPNIKIPELNALLKQMTAEQQVPYLDYFSAMADERNGLPQAYTTDEVHLTKAGYAIMKKMVVEAISAALEN